MGKFKFNPFTGDLDRTLSTKEVEIIVAANAPTKIVGAQGSVVTENADMDDTGIMNTAGIVQIKDSSGEGRVQIAGNTLLMGPLMHRVQESYMVVLEVGRNWLFAGATNVRERIIKCTLPAGQIVSLFSGNNIGNITTIFFGDHVNFFEPFTVTCPGVGIIGHPTGVVFGKKGDSATFRQTASSEYVIESSNFDTTGTAGVSTDTVSIHSNAAVVTPAGDVTHVNLSGAGAKQVVLPDALVDQTGRAIYIATDGLGQSLSAVTVGGATILNTTDVLQNRSLFIATIIVNSASLYQWIITRVDNLPSKNTSYTTSSSHSTGQDRAILTFAGSGNKIVTVPEGDFANSGRVIYVNYSTVTTETLSFQTDGAQGNFGTVSPTGGDQVYMLYLSRVAGGAHNWRYIALNAEAAGGTNNPLSIKTYSAVTAHGATVLSLANLDTAKQYYVTVNSKFSTLTETPNQIVFQYVDGLATVVDKIVNLDTSLAGTAVEQSNTFILNPTNVAGTLDIVAAMTNSTGTGQLDLIITIEELNNTSIGTF